MLQEKKERIEELFQQDTDAIAKEIGAAESEDDLIAVFANHGVELTEEDVQEIMDSVPQASGELDDDQLESISGGIYISVITGGVAKAIKDAIDAIKRRNSPSGIARKVIENTIKNNIRTM